MFKYDRDVSAIADLLPTAMYPDGWASHYENGLCDICPSCDNRALVTAHVVDDEHDEVYDIGRGCDYCQYSDTF